MHSLSPEQQGRDTVIPDRLGGHGRPIVSSLGQTGLSSEGMMQSPPDSTSPCLHWHTVQLQYVMQFWKLLQFKEQVVGIFVSGEGLGEGFDRTCECIIEDRLVYLILEEGITNVVRGGGMNSDKGEINSVEYNIDSLWEKLKEEANIESDENSNSVVGKGLMDGLRENIFEIRKDGDGVMKRELLTSITVEETRGLRQVKVCVDSSQIQVSFLAQSW